MATVLEFPATRPSMPRPDGPGLGGEIVFFPGVRFERRDPDPREAAEPALPDHH